MRQPGMPLLPEELIRYLPDSELSVTSWNVRDAILVLGLEKEVSEERGIVTFHAVSRVSLPPVLQIAGLECAKDSQFLVDPLEADELLFIIRGTSWEQPFYVVAKSVTYQTAR